MPEFRYAYTTRIIMTNHNWNDREDRAYRNYQQERHEQYLAYEHRKHSYQQHYWKWLHSHPDRD
jgi:hypothetical protein